MRHKQSFIGERTHSIPLADVQSLSIPIARRRRNKTTSRVKDGDVLIPPSYFIQPKRWPKNVTAQLRDGGRSKVKKKKRGGGGVPNPETVFEMRLNV